MLILDTDTKVERRIGGIENRLIFASPSWAFASTINITLSFVLHHFQIFFQIFQVWSLIYTIYLFIHNLHKQVLMK